MLIFWLLVLLMAGLTVALLLRSLLRGGAAAGEGRGVNLALYREREAELAAELTAGQLAPEALEAARMELKRELLDSLEGEESPPLPASPWGVWGVALALPLTALLFYLTLGNPGLVTPPPDHARAAPEAEGAPPAEMEGLVKQLAERLRRQPDDPEGWALLGRSLEVMEQHQEAAAAFERSRALGGDSADLLIEEAQALAMVQGGKLAGAPMERVQKALALAPEFPDALWFSGLDALQRGDQGTAVATWERILTLMPEGAEGRATVEQAITQARGQMGVVKPAPGSAAVVERKLEVRVRLDAALAERVAPEDTVFIFARAQGGRMPVVAVRRSARELPLALTLDDSQRLGELRLSGLDEVEVVARIGKGGDALSASGDLEGRAHAHVGEGVEVVISEVVP